MFRPGVPGGAPFVQSLLFCVGYWILDCKPPHCSPILFGVVLWLCGAFHWLLGRDFHSSTSHINLSLFRH